MSFSSKGPTETAPVDTGHRLSTSSAPLDSLRVYTVQKGDSLLKVAMQSHSTIAELFALNPELSSGRLQPGQQLRIPDGAPSHPTDDSVLAGPEARFAKPLARTNPGLSPETLFAAKGVNMPKKADAVPVPVGADSGNFGALARSFGANPFSASTLASDPRQNQQQKQPEDGSSQRDAVSFGAAAKPQRANASGSSSPRVDAVNPRENGAPTALSDEDDILTEAEILAVMPKATAENIKRYLGPLIRAMRKYGLTSNDPKVAQMRRSAFLAQIAVETGDLAYSREIASGQAYEGRAGLGNTQPGDGPRYKGRGLIQLTGRANYRQVGRALGYDLENHPELAEEPRISAEVAAYFFQHYGLIALADKGDIDTISRRVNGGTNGLSARRNRYLAGMNYSGDDRPIA